MKNIHVIEIQANSMEDGIKQAMEQVGKAIKESMETEKPEAEDHVLKDIIKDLEATIELVDGRLTHAMTCPGCAKRVDKNLAMAAFKDSMKTAVTALQEVIKAEEAVIQETIKAREAR